MRSTIAFLKQHRTRILLTFVFLGILLYSYGCMCGGGEEGKKGDDRSDGSESSEDRATIRNELCARFGGKFCDYNCEPTDQACINFVQELSRPSLEASKLIQGTNIRYQVSYHIEASAPGHARVYLLATDNTAKELLNPASIPVEANEDVGNEESFMLTQDFQKLCADITPLSTALQAKTYCEEIVAFYGPSFTVPLSLSLTEDTNTTLQVTATDQDCTAPCQLTYSLENTSSIATINPTTGLISFTPRQEHVDASPITMAVIVYDNEGNSQTQHIALTITGVNDAPQIIGLPDITLLEETPYSFDLYEYIEDPDNALSDLVVTTSEPSGIQATLFERTLTLTPGEDVTGTRQLTVTARDPSGATARKIVIIRINPVNDEPYFTMGFADQVLQEDFAPVTIDLSTLINDRDTQKSSLTLNAEVLGDQIVTAQIIPPHALRIRPVRDQNGDSAVRITLSDGTAQAEQLMRIIVNPTNDAPRFTESGTFVSLTNALPNRIIDLRSLVNDPDDPDGESLQFIYQTSTDYTQDLGVTFSGTSITFSKRPESSPYFSYLFIVTVFDPQYASDSTTISVGYDGS